MKKEVYKSKTSKVKHEKGESKAKKASEKKGGKRS